MDAGQEFFFRICVILRGLRATSDSVAARMAVYVAVPEISEAKMGLGRRLCFGYNLSDCTKQREKEDEYRGFLAG